MDTQQPSTERPKPYIGISGLVDKNQQRLLVDRFTSHGVDDDRRIALGVKAVHKTQFLDQENKYGPRWYPVGEDGFFSALGKGGESLHVAQIYLDPEYVHDPEYRSAFVNRIRRRGKEWLNALQFDMLPWHSDTTILPWLEQLKTSTGIDILLQAHGPAMQELGPEQTAKKLGRYASAISFVLFDASHGRGIRMNPGALEPFLNAAYSSDSLNKVGISVAGGLNAGVVRDDLPKLLSTYPDLSWDAEGQLHYPEGSQDRPLDMQKTLDYLEASADILTIAKEL